MVVLRLLLMTPVVLTLHATGARASRMPSRVQVQVEDGGVPRAMRLYAAKTHGRQYRAHPHEHLYFRQIPQWKHWRLDETQGI